MREPHRHEELLQEALEIIGDGALALLHDVF